VLNESIRARVELISSNKKMLKEHSIVKVDKRPYRVIAQENWGLTDAQMKGMHVHHRILRSQGGTNDPCNLYVCSPSFHRYVWHNGETFIEWASVGGKSKTSEQQAKAGRLGGKSKKSLEARRRSGCDAVINQTGIHSLAYKNSEKYIENKRKAGAAGSVENKLKGTRKVNSQKWMSTVDGFISTAAGVVSHHKSLNYPTDARILLSNSPSQPC
jgi:hypothetical protein